MFADDALVSRGALIDAGALVSRGALIDAGALIADLDVCVGRATAERE